MIILITVLVFVVLIFVTSNNISNTQINSISSDGTGTSTVIRTAPNDFYVTIPPNKCVSSVSYSMLPNPRTSFPYDIDVYCGDAEFDIVNTRSAINFYGAKGTINKPTFTEFDIQNIDFFCSMNTSRQVYIDIFGGDSANSEDIFIVEVFFVSYNDFVGS